MDQLFTFGAKLQVGRAYRVAVFALSPSETPKNKGFRIRGYVAFQNLRRQKRWQAPERGNEVGRPDFIMISMLVYLHLSLARRLPPRSRSLPTAVIGWLSVWRR